MDLTGVSPIAAFVAGIISVFSPCVLPLLPAILAYSTEKGSLRPLAIVVGLSISFTTMGIATSMVGSVFRQYFAYLSIIAAGVIIILGISLIFELGMPRFLSTLSNLNVGGKGLLGGLLLGLSLGVIWMPCVGPILGAILTLVAVEGDIVYGALMLFIYSLGFAIPMLLVAYSASFSSARLGTVSRYDVVIKKIAGVALVAVGIWMVYTSPLIAML
ncbi:MAG: cytochrome c biogenesis CcdA family protein [Methanosarcinaceae archaeon]|nr:cytochrome c biogenesis CcdA family protein [Methanosarcinaceae archaeon]